MAPVNRISPKDGYAKANSSNLPSVDITMLADFFNRTKMFVNNESSGVKLNRSVGARYGDEAVGRVRVKNIKKSCSVVAEVTPEHKIRTQPYIVTVMADMTCRKIKSAQCDGCIAALGGCKHAIAVIGWLHRRTEEPSPTEEICYWKKSTLATVDINKPYESDVVESSSYSDSEESNSNGFIAKFVSKCEKENSSCHFLLHYNFNAFSSPLLKVSLHHLMCDFLESKIVLSANNFIRFCRQNMKQNVLQTISIETKFQYKSSLWRELRYGRITGSVAYEVAHCKTSDGSLIDKLFGRKIIDTKAMKRGRDLEPQVKAAIELRLREKINDSGLWLTADYPVFGASPDGFGPRRSYCVEIKCPSTQETYKNYIKDGKISKQCFAQVQLQMHMTKITKTKFCVADPNFEFNKKVEIIDVIYDKDYTHELISCCLKFWIKSVYPKIYEVVK